MRGGEKTPPRSDLIFVSSIGRIYVYVGYLKFFFAAVSL